MICLGPMYIYGASLVQTQVYCVYCNIVTCLNEGRVWCHASERISPLAFMYDMQPICFALEVHGNNTNSPINILQLCKSEILLCLFINH